MTAKHAHIITGITVLLLWCALFVMFPYYKYYIDPDGVAYLTISRRYANGDYLRAINGYWSPWSCWLTAGLIKMGWADITASVAINALGAGLFVAVSNSFFSLFGLNKERIWLNATLLIFCCYVVFAQSFDDIWECFFLLTALRIMLMEHFMSKPGLWVITASMGALAYFAKAYSFPFFNLNTLICVYFISNRKLTNSLKVSVSIIVMMFVFSLPWIVALHYKYGIWTTSTAGSLNLSWYLVGHPFWKDGIELLIPPPYPDSPYHWEDPFVANGPTPHFWNSWYYAGMQILRLGLNAWKFTYSVVQLSPLLFITILVTGWRLIKGKKAAVISPAQKVAFISVCLFPLGYAIINYESRYLWYVLPVAISATIQYPSLPGLVTSRRLMMPLVAISFMIYPAWQLYLMCNNGKAEYELALKLQKAGLQGSFTGNEHPRIMGRLAYLWGSSYYYTTNINAKEEEYLNEAGRYGVQYYIRYYNRFAGDTAVRQLKLPVNYNLQEHALPVEVYNDRTSVQVFKLN